MKKTLFILISLFALSIIKAQTPNQFKYQAVLRDVSSNVLSNQQVSVEVAILEGDVLGTSVFTETHSVTTNAQGLININIGSINDLGFIDWSADTYFIQISVDGNIMGTSQLLSVPYALSAKKTENYDETDPVFTSWDKSSGINITESQIIDLKNYLTAETDPVFTSWDKSSGINITESQIIDLKNYLTTEIDGDVTNEIQDLSFQDNILSITNNDNATDIDLSGYLDNTDSQDLANVLTQGNDAGNKRIKNIDSPTDKQDAATKKYIDEILIQAGFFTAKDVDGNVYKTVKIGDQVWMAEDLRVTHYPNGDPIPNVSGSSEWSALSQTNTDDAYCFFNNNASTDYGALYTYAAAIADNWQRDNDTFNAEGGQGICPNGWHLPTASEWDTLISYLGGEEVAGGKLKEIGLDHWESPNEGATNSSGFTALGTGYRYDTNGDFVSFNTRIFWWSGKESSGTSLVYALSNSNENVYSGYQNKTFGFCVRCIKNN